MKRFIPVVLLLLIALGCSTFSAMRYSVSADNIVTLRTLNGKTVSVGAFSAASPGQTEIMCRGVGPIKTPDGEPFSEYVRKAILDDLRIANVYAESAPITLTGHLEAIDFSSNSGEWNLSLTVKSSNGKSITITETYKYTTSFLWRNRLCADSSGLDASSPEFSRETLPIS